MENTQKTSRNVFLDFVKVLALVRVFLWHATSWAPLTYIASIPVMVLAAGFLFEKSRSRSSVVEVVKSRLWRLLVPFWLFASLALSVMAAKDSSLALLSLPDVLSWILPLRDPVGSSWQQGWITEPLWYLRAYLWLLLASPVIVKAVKKGPGEVLAVLAISVIVCEQLLGANAWAFQDFLLYGFFWTLGMILAGRQSFVTSRQSFKLGAFLALISAAIYVIQAPLDGVVNNSHTLHLFVGSSTLALLWAARKQLEALASSRLLSRVSQSISRNGLTVYLYHAPMLGFAYLLLGALGLKEGLTLTLVAVLFGALLTIAAVKFAGPAEQWSKHKSITNASMYRPNSLPKLVAKTSALSLVLYVAIVTVNPFASGTFVPQTPSKAPEAAVFEVNPDETFLLEGSNASVNADPTPTTRATTTREKVTADRYNPATKPPTTKEPKKVTPKPDGRPTLVNWVPDLSALASWDQSAPDMDAGKRSAIELLFTRWAAKNKLSSAQIGLLLPGRSKLLLSANEEGVLQDAPSSVAYNSVTKSFTSVLILRAVAQGKVALDDKVGILEVAPWFDAARDVTVAQLLGHRSGLTPYAETRAFKENAASIDSWKSSLKAAQEDGPRFQPGASVEYSSTNFIVAGLLAEKLYGAPIETLLEREITGPLNLPSIVFKKPFPGSPGTGTGNAEGSLQDVMRWTSALWRDGVVLGPANSHVANYAENTSNLGYGTFAYCPCTSSGLKAAYGTNGAQITSRYYAALDVVILVRTTSGVIPQVEDLISEVLRELA